MDFSIPSSHEQLTFFLANHQIHFIFFGGGGGVESAVVECLTQDRGCEVEPHCRHCFVSLSKSINPSLVLVQPRKTCPFITERLLMGRKESNQTNFVFSMFSKRLTEGPE